MTQETYYKWKMAGGLLTQLDATKRILKDQIDNAGKPDAMLSMDQVEMLKNAKKEIDRRYNVVFEIKSKLEEHEFNLVQTSKGTTGTKS